jgi:hypothetical protein
MNGTSPSTMGRPFLTITQIGEIPICGRNGWDMPVLVSRQVCLIREYLSQINLMHVSAPEASLFGCSRTKKDRIPIMMDANGSPELPSVTAADGCHVKSIQSALQEYCLAHICKSGNIF